MKAIYGLIGKRLGHSFSADFFNKKFGAESIDAEYILMPIPSVEELPTLFERYEGLRGFNVTIPYKEAVIPYLSSLSPLAEEIGAVNVVMVETAADGRRILTGHNSDAYGFTESIRPLVPEGARRALVLGTGGASKAVVASLKTLGLDVALVSRNPHNNPRNPDRSGVRALGYDMLTPELISDYKVIVNATPLGMSPDVDRAPDIPYEGISGGHLCYDLVYNPEETLFMRLCRQRGAVVKNGLEMLHLQALRAWEIWSSPDIC